MLDICSFSSDTIRNPFSYYFFLSSKLLLLYLLEFPTLLVQ